MHLQTKQTRLQSVLCFFITKMIIGIAVIISLVAMVEWLRSLIPDKTNLTEDIKALITAIAEAIIATTGYIFLFKKYERRHIQELSASTFFSNATAGFLTGLLLQTSFIVIICLAGNFLIANINSVSALIGPFAFALTAGFVAEIIIIGILFRLLEQQTGTSIALFIFIILFALLHINVKGANSLSVAATAMQAGWMLPAAYVFSRNLWLPVFIHVGWDFAEPGIFGCINPSSSLTQGLLTSKTRGNFLLTGGGNGPQDSLTSLLLCLLQDLSF